MTTRTPTVKRTRNKQRAPAPSQRNGRYSVNLPALMAECDSNYLRLCKLFPAVRDTDSHQFALARGELIMHVNMQVIERGPYTTLLRLTQTPAGLAQADPQTISQWTPEPRITVRLYHDARCAEVVDFQRARHFRAVYDYPNPHMRHPDEKAQVNRFLGEFLAFCLDAGVALDAPLPESV